MEEMTIIETLEKYPYLKDYLDKVIILSSGKFHSYENDIKVTKGKKKISLTLLKDLIESDKYYKYIEKLLVGELTELKITKLANGDLINGFNYSISTISKLLKVALSEHNLKFNDQEMLKCKKIFEATDLDKFKSDYKDKEYICKINNIEYKISTNDIINFMELKENEYNKLCLAQSIKELYGLKKEYFVYAVLHFFLDNKIKDKYDLPKNYLLRLHEIEDNKKIDIQSINHIPKTYDPNASKVKITEELRKTIIGDMPDKLSLLEKAIYIYIKMCKIFTYNEEFYAVDQAGEIAKRHEDISRISTLSEKNNSLVCYEFNEIYGHLLAELGINYEVDQALVDSYGGGHANLKFVVDKYIIFADSVTTVLSGDLGRAKTNRPLNGLRCVNKNEYTCNEFEKKLKKMYQLVMNKEKVPRKETFEKILSLYQNNTNNLNEVPLEERLDILIKRVNSKKLQPVDNISYLLALSKILFTEQERIYYFKTPIIRFNDNDKARIAVILTLSINNEYIYYFYTPNSEMYIMSQTEVENNFNNNIFEYINVDDIRIPGINGGRK